MGAHRHPLAPEVSHLLDSPAEEVVLLEGALRRTVVESGGQGGAPQAVSQGDVVDHFAHQVHHRVDVEGVADESVLAVPREVGRASFLGHQDHAACGHGLERRATEGLVVREVEEEVDVAQQPEDPLRSRDAVMLQRHLRRQRGELSGFAAEGHEAQATGVAPIELLEDLQSPPRGPPGGLRPDHRRDLELVLLDRPRARRIEDVEVDAARDFLDRNPVLERQAFDHPATDRDAVPRARPVRAQRRGVHGAARWVEGRLVVLDEVERHDPRVSLEDPVLQRHRDVVGGHDGVERRGEGGEILLASVEAERRQVPLLCQVAIAFRSRDRHREAKPSETAGVVQDLDHATEVAERRQHEQDRGLGLALGHRDQPFAEAVQGGNGGQAPLEGRDLGGAEAIDVSTVRLGFELSGARPKSPTPVVEDVAVVRDAAAEAGSLGAAGEFVLLAVALGRERLVERPQGLQRLGPDHPAHAGHVGNFGIGTLREPGHHLAPRPELDRQGIRRPAAAIDDARHALVAGAIRYRPDDRGVRARLHAAQETLQPAARHLGVAVQQHAVGRGAERETDVGRACVAEGAGIAVQREVREGERFEEGPGLLPAAVVDHDQSHRHRRAADDRFETRAGHVQLVLDADDHVDPRGAIEAEGVRSEGFGARRPAPRHVLLGGGGTIAAAAVHQAAQRTAQPPRGRSEQRLGPLLPVLPRRDLGVELGLELRDEEPLLGLPRPRVGRARGRGMKRDAGQLAVLTPGGPSGRAADLSLERFEARHDLLQATAYEVERTGRLGFDDANPGDFFQSRSSPAGLRDSRY